MSIVCKRSNNSAIRGILSEAQTLMETQAAIVSDVESCIALAQATNNEAILDILTRIQANLGRQIG